MANPSAVHNQDGPETILPVIRPTISYYLVLALVVIPFRAVTPASWCYVVYCLYTGAIWTFTSRQCALFIAALAEVGPLLDSNVTSDDQPRAHTSRCSSVYTTIIWRNSSLDPPPLNLRTSSIYRLLSVVYYRRVWPDYRRMDLVMTKRWTLITQEVPQNPLQPLPSMTPALWISVHT